MIWLTTPPSTRIGVPVTGAAAGEDSQTTTDATSSGVPKRSIAWRASIVSRMPPCSNSGPASGVSIGPGQTQFTRMPRRPP